MTTPVPRPTGTTAVPPPGATAASGHVGRIVVVGLVAGFLSGLFGVGGGILIVPALVLVLHFDQRLAHGTSLAAVLPIAVASFTLSTEAFTCDSHSGWSGWSSSPMRETKVS